MHGFHRISITAGHLQRVAKTRLLLSPNRINWQAQLAASSTGSFVKRHIGPDEQEQKEMLRTLGYESMDKLIDQVVPKSILFQRALRLDAPLSEAQMLKQLREKLSQNKLYRSYIGIGFYNTDTPTPILRNVFENPGWYTAYTPYQPEIAQGRMESLFNYQTMVSDLTKLPVANASLLDEATAAAEAMTVAVRKMRKNKILLFQGCHPTTNSLILSRASGLRIAVDMVTEKGQLFEKLASGEYAGVILQYPDTDGNLNASLVEEISRACKKHEALLCVASDLLALTLVKSPGELGADIAFGSAQRFGVPLGYGGPSAAFFATSTDMLRMVPGRIIGKSVDKMGQVAYRLTLQTREQHIRRERATSNVCTTQALLANMAAFYAIYHGPQGLKDIATRVHQNTVQLAESLTAAGHVILNQGEAVFDTIKVQPRLARAEVEKRALAKGINLRYFPDHDSEAIGISLDETVTQTDLQDLAEIFDAKLVSSSLDSSRLSIFQEANAKCLIRSSGFLKHPVFNQYQNETALMRYMKTLENKDISLVHSIIPLGSCTMKLNSASELIPCSWPTVNQIHPFVPRDQVKGYLEMLKELEDDLAEITGYDKVCLTPNSGAQGEYAGLRAIAEYLRSVNQGHRKICLIPVTAHGTNPASAVMAGMEVKPVKATSVGSVDMYHLREQLDRFKDQLAAIMITYPSTSGVFDEEVPEICQLVHESGGQVYMDGANMNALVGLCRPGEIGSDVSHLNLHKTFCIPHGGGGPGMGPIGVKQHLIPFLPNHPFGATLAGQVSGKFSTSELAVCSAPFGSASILPISWAYIKMMGPEGLKNATEVAILAANYMMHKLNGAYQAKYTNKQGHCAHEFILDCSQFKQHGVEAIDIAKRLMDFGFHCPTMSWPVPSSLMVEPTESEPKDECDRLCEALLTIRSEIDKVSRGEWSYQSSPLHHAPHTMDDLVALKWDRPYSREQATFPGSWQMTKFHGKAQQKIWPTVSRINDTYGDQNVICTCDPVLI